MSTKITRTFNNYFNFHHRKVTKGGKKMVTKLNIIISKCYSGIATRTGRHAFLSSRWRKAAESGRRNPFPPRLAEKPLEDSANKRSRSSHLPSGAPPSGGDDTNKSFSLCRALNSRELPPAAASSRRAPRVSPRRSLRRLLLPRSMRRVLRRRRWMTGLAAGLRVGLGATAHCAASCLNLCRVVATRMMCADPAVRKNRKRN